MKAEEFSIEVCFNLDGEVPILSTVFSATMTMRPLPIPIPLLCSHLVLQRGKGDMMVIMVVFVMSNPCSPNPAE